MPDGVYDLLASKLLREHEAKEPDEGEQHRVYRQLLAILSDPHRVKRYLKGGADWLARRSLGHDRGHDLTEPAMDASSELQAAGERQRLLQVEIAAIEKKLTDRKEARRKTLDGKYVFSVFAPRPNTQCI